MDGVFVTRLAKFALSSAGLVVAAVLADYAVFRWSPLQSQSRRLLKSLADTVTHGAIAGWCWATALVLSGRPCWSPTALTQTLISVALGSVIDLDHFWAAGSLSLEDAMSLPHRPPAHNTLLVVLGTLFLFLAVSLFPRLCPIPTFLQDLPFIFFMATFSHHLRDADRRGIWFGPWNTPAISHKLYLVITISLPALFATYQTLFQYTHARPIAPIITA